MSKSFKINPRTDLVFERFIDAPRHLVWEALTRPEHLKEWYMPKPWGAVSACEMDRERQGQRLAARDRDRHGSVRGAREGVDAGKKMKALASVTITPVRVA